jgi:isovaleryl-CoA dehydrogenase
VDFSLTDEQLAIQDMVRKFAKNELAPLAVQIDRESRFPAETFKKMGELGLLGAMVPEEYGGTGQTVLTCCIIAAEMAAACASTAMSYLAHALLCAHNLASNGSPEQKKKYLPDLASGKKIGSIAMTEPGAGSDVLSLTTSAKRENGEYVLNGTKTFITNAPVADVFLVYARVRQDATAVRPADHDVRDDRREAGEHEHGTGGREAADVQGG